jgi:hypothetical protein
MKETELAQKFVEYFSDFDLYFEAPPHHVDIVAISGPKYIAIEVKTSLNFKVIEQAVRNQGWFHLSYIAVPRPKDGHFQYKICQHFGVGVLTYYPSYSRGYIQEQVKPRWNKVGDIAKKYCNYQDYMKQSVPGSSGSDGAIVTPFKMTVENLERYVKRHPGCTLKEALQNIDYHYTSFSGAKSSLYKWMREGVIDTVILIDGKLHLNNKNIEEQ